MAPILPSSLSALLLLSAALPMASGHDHDSSHIEEGMAISVDPIVRALPTNSRELRGWLKADDTESNLFNVGYNAMDTHLHSDGRLGRHLPCGRGSRGKEAL